MHADRLSQLFNLAVRSSSAPSALVHSWTHSSRLASSQTLPPGDSCLVHRNYGDCVTSRVNTPVRVKRRGDGVDADVGLALFGSQKVELMFSAVHHHVATALHEVASEGFNAGDGAVVGEQPACGGHDFCPCWNR